MIKIGVIGAGHLGKIHIRLLKEIKTVQLIGIYDHNAEHAQSVAKEFGVKAFSSSEELLDLVDAVDIVTPTVSHFEYAVLAMKRSKHLFIEYFDRPAIKE